MSISIDHVGVPAVDPEASAQLLGEILGEGATSPQGPDCEMFNLSVGRSALTYFQMSAPFPHHIALRVTEPVFVGAIQRLRSLGMPFGNDPGDPTNGNTFDPLGGLGRIYFCDHNDHLFELFVATKD